MTPESGLATERTELAWRRTAVAFAALGGALVKADPAVGLPALAFGTWIWDAGRCRPLVITAGVVVLAAAALLTG